MPCETSLTVIRFAHTGAARTSETLPTSDDVPNVAQDVLGNIHGKKDTAGTGDKITPALRRIFESTSRGITFEDLKPGLGHQVQEHSIVTFSTKMKDSVGAMVNHFSYELARDHHLFIIPETHDT